MRTWFSGRAGMALTFIIGMLVATAGTATAARLITGKQIKDGSISGKDLSRAVQAQLKKAGVPGSQGAAGKDGAQGAPGASGARGDQGLKGDAGLQGLPGLNGVKGDKGDQGIQGITGDQGIQGVKGDPGPSEVLEQTVITPVALPINGSYQQIAQILLSSATVSARAVVTLLGGGSATTAQCQIGVGAFGGGVAFTSTQSVVAGSYATVSVDKSYSFMGNGAATLFCAGAGAQVYRAVLTVTKVGSYTAA